MTQLLHLDAGTLAYWNSILANRGYSTGQLFDTADDCVTQSVDLQSRSTYIIAV